MRSDREDFNHHFDVVNLKNDRRKTRINTQHKTEQNKKAMALTSSIRFKREREGGHDTHDGDMTPCRARTGVSSGDGRYRERTDGGQGAVPELPLEAPPRPDHRAPSEIVRHCCKPS